MPSNITIIEAITGQVDADTGVIRGCKIVGLESKKGRRYATDALRRAAGLYEGVVVNIDHKGGDRGFADRFGRFRNVRFEEGRGLFGDLQFNPSHPMAKTVVWWAEHDPNAAGFSHVAKGRSKINKADATEIVEDIQAVASVDLVANPATTNGFFESQGQSEEEPVLLKAFREADHAERQELLAFIESEDGGNAVDLKDATITQLKESRPDLVTAILAESEASKEVKELTQKYQESVAELERLREKEKRAARRDAIVQMCDDAKLPQAARTTFFMESLAALEDDAAVRSAIDEQVKVVGHLPAGPVSREQRFGEYQESDYDDFAEAELKACARRLTS